MNKSISKLYNINVLRIIGIIILLFIVYSNSAFAETQDTIQIDSNMSAEDIINNIDDEGKKQMILKFFEPIYVYFDNDNSIAHGDSEKIYNRLKTLASMSKEELNDEMKKQLYKLIEETKDSKNDGYFSSEGVAIIKEILPDKLNSIVTAEEFFYKKQFDFLEKSSTHNSTKDSIVREYKKQNTVGYTSLEGKAYCLTVYIEWKTKSGKIVSKKSSYSTWTNTLWSVEGVKKITDTIDSRGFGNIVYKGRFKHNVGLPVIKTIRNEAWFYGDGGCDWSY